MFKSILKMFKIKLLSFKIFFTLSLSILAFLSLFISEALYAAVQHRTLGEIANTLIVGTDFVTRIMLVATLVMGVGFILFSIGLFRTHWRNPKLVPLDRPIIYCVLGIVLCIIPFLGHIFGGTLSTLDLEKNPHAVTQHQQNTMHHGNYVDVDAPIHH